MNCARSQRFTLALVIEALQQRLRRLDRRQVLSRYPKQIATIIDLDTQPLLYLTQVRIELATQIGKAVVIRWFETEIDRMWLSVQVFQKF